MKVLLQLVFANSRREGSNVPGIIRDFMFSWPDYGGTSSHCGAYAPVR